MNGENDTMYYVSKDYLGSFDVITDERGNVLERYSFDPWGRRRNPTDWTFTDVPAPHLFDRGFTGHEHLDKFGLINMNGRVYDPWLSRFLSPDPFVQTPTYSQSYNRYSYCLNNPLKYVDPSGYRQKPFFEWEANATYYGNGGGFNGRIGPGSGNHWSDGMGSTFSNFMMMDQRTFVNFYGQDTYDGIFENYVNTQETPASDDSFNGAIYYLNLDNGGWSPVAVVDAEGNRLTIVESLEGEGNSINYYLHFIESTNDSENGGVDAMDIASYFVSNSGMLAGGAKFAINSISNQQQWKYSYKAHKYLKNKGINIKTSAIKNSATGVLNNASRKITYVGGILALADVAIDGELRASHLLNAGMVGISAIPGAGWIIGGAYFVADMITLGVSGQTIGQHFDEAVGSPLINDIYNW